MEKKHSEFIHNLKAIWNMIGFDEDEVTYRVDMLLGELGVKNIFMILKTHFPDYF
jgi:hypothetical protein